MKKLELSFIILVIILIGFSNSLMLRKIKGNLKSKISGLKELNLTEQQKEKLKKLNLIYEEANIETEAKLKNE